MIEDFNNWIDVNQRLKNVEHLIEKYPTDLSLHVEQQELKKTEAKLKAKLDKSRAIKEAVEQVQSDVGMNTW
jgi:predicted DNA-binding protein YlxM (UPF0122 family)